MSKLSPKLSDFKSVDGGTKDSVLMSTGSSRAFWLSLSSPALFEIFSWMNEMFNPCGIIKPTATVGDLFVSLKRTA